MDTFIFLIACSIVAVVMVLVVNWYEKKKNIPEEQIIEPIVEDRHVSVLSSIPLDDKPNESVSSSSINLFPAIPTIPIDDGPTVLPGFSVDDPDDNLTIEPDSQVEVQEDPITCEPDSNTDFDFDSSSSDFGSSD